MNKKEVLGKFHNYLEQKIWYCRSMEGKYLGEPINRGNLGDELDYAFYFFSTTFKSPIDTTKCFTHQQKDTIENISLFHITSYIRPSDIPSSKEDKYRIMIYIHYGNSLPCEKVFESLLEKYDDEYIEELAEQACNAITN